MYYSTEDLNILINKRHKKNPDLYFHLSKFNKSKNILENIHQPIVEEFNCGGRPNGLWYSHGNSWINMLIKNKNTHPIFKTCCYLYELNIDKKNILSIDTVEKLNNFDKKVKDYYLNNEDFYLCDFRGLNPTKFIDYSTYNKPYYKNKTIFEFLEDKKAVFSNKTDFTNHIKKYIIDYDNNYIENRRNKRWDLVAKNYCGIEFSPYQINTNINWYKSIAINSGCIWDVSAIKHLSLIAKVVSQKHDHTKNLWELTDYGETLLL